MRLGWRTTPNVATMDLEVPPDRPATEILEIGLKPIGEMVLVNGRAAKAADLSQSSHPGLHRVTMEITIVDLPENVILGGRAERMRTWPDNAHVAQNHIDELRQFIEAGTPG